VNNHLPPRAAGEDDIPELKMPKKIIYHYFVLTLEI